MMSPILKATLQAAALSTVSNILAQCIQAYRISLPLDVNFVELLRFVILTLITAPPNYKWQQFLEQTFPAYDATVPTALPVTRRDAEKPETKDHEDADPQRGRERSKRSLNLRNTFFKWFIDCITLGALVNTVAFLAIMGLLKGQETAQIQHNVRKETVPIILAGYRIWPIASIVSFSFVPVEKRIVFLSFIGLLWGIYMSMVAARV